MIEKQHLIGLLAYWLAAGKRGRAGGAASDPRTLAADHPKSLPAILEALEGEADEALVTLAGALRLTLRKEASRWGC